jgi:hypothetical protein
MVTDAEREAHLREHFQELRAHIEHETHPGPEKTRALLYLDEAERHARNASHAPLPVTAAPSVVSA